MEDTSEKSKDTVTTDIKVVAVKTEKDIPLRKDVFILNPGHNQAFLAIKKDGQQLADPTFVTFYQTEKNAKTQRVLRDFGNENALSAYALVDIPGFFSKDPDREQIDEMANLLQEEIANAPREKRDTKPFRNQIK